VSTLRVLPGDTCVDDLTRALAALGEDAPAELIAVVLLTRHQVHLALGAHDACLRDLDAVRALGGAPPGLRSLALVYRGTQERFAGAARVAWTTHERAERELEGIHAPRLRALSDACMGRLAWDLREADRSRSYNERAYAACEALGDTWLGALPLANLAQLAQEEQRFEEARALLERAIERLRAAGEVYYATFYASVCGDLYFEWGKHEVARRWYTEGERPLGFTASRHAAGLHAARAALEASDGDFVHADAHLGRAEGSASRVANPVVRLLVDLHAAHVDAARGTDPSRVRRARTLADDALCGASAAAELARTSLDVRFALRMLVRALDRADRAGVATLEVEETGLWFAAAEGARVDLGRRGALRRILRALAVGHSTHPDRGLPVEALIAEGWPGQRVLVEAAATRVRVAIATLRRLGLRAVLLTREDGYLLDPRARVAMRAS
jgi:hypothetical protein